MLLCSTFYHLIPERLHHNCIAYGYYVHQDQASLCSPGCEEIKIELQNHFEEKRRERMK